MNSRHHLTFKSTFKAEKPRNWLKQVWMLKIWSVINCIFVHWAKKLTLIIFYIRFQYLFTHDSSITFLFKHQKPLFFVMSKMKLEIQGRACRFQKRFEKVTGHSNPGFFESQVSTPDFSILDFFSIRDISTMNFSTFWGWKVQGCCLGLKSYLQLREY